MRAETHIHEGPHYTREAKGDPGGENPSPYTQSLWSSEHTRASPSPSHICSCSSLCLCYLPHPFLYLKAPTHSTRTSSKSASSENPSLPQSHSRHIQLCRLCSAQGHPAP